MKEQRKHRRLHLQLPLRVRGSDKNGQEIEFNSMTENVSTGGAYFLTSNPMEQDMKVSVFVSVPYEIFSVLLPKVLESEAVIVRVSALKERPNDHMGIAIKFLKDLSWKREVTETA